MLNTTLLSPAVQALVSTWIGVIRQSDQNPVDKYAEMLKESPVASAANDLRTLLGVSMMGKYQHFDENIQEFVLTSINRMDGSWSNVIAEILTFVPFGRSFSEVSYAIKKRKAYLDKIRTIDPRYYWFEGYSGNIKQVHYLKNTDIYIPYENGIHLINQPYLALGGDPYGVATCRKAYPFWQLTKIINACLAIISETQGKMLVGKTDTANNSAVMINPDTGSPYLDPVTGEPKLYNQGYVMSKNLAESRTNAFAVIDIADEIFAVANETNGDFWINILSYLESMIMLSWLVPKTVTGMGMSGSGDSNLNAGHRNILELVIKSQMELVGDTLIEKVIRPMIEFNFGEQKDYGIFPVKTQDNEDAIALLSVVNNCVTSGTFSGEDLAVVNRMRELAGIVPLESLETSVDTEENVAEKKYSSWATKSAQESNSFYWNANSQQYHYANGNKKGQFVREKDVVRITEKAIEYELQAGNKITKDLLSGKINVSTWEQKTAQSIRNLAIYQYSLGIGGIKQMDWRDHAEISGKVNLQYQYLRGFSRDIIQGNLSEAQILARVQMYYNKTRHFYEDGRLEGHARNGFLWERRVLAAFHSCDDCVRYSGVGWVKIGTLPNPGENCQCRANCKCVKYYSKSPILPSL
ncbi:MAG: phage portal protein family protein [Dolichospermum sp.]